MRCGSVGEGRVKVCEMWKCGRTVKVCEMWECGGGGGL